MFAVTFVHVRTG